MKFVSSLNFPVSDIASVSNLLCKHFGFEIEVEDENSTLINNGILSIRLIKVESKEQSNLYFDYSVENIQDALEELTKIGFETKSELEFISILREQILLKGPFGITILLYRIYNEEELNIVLDLETSLEWDKDAIDIAQHIMRSVPADFRKLAKVKVIEAAESNAIVEGESRVKLNMAINAIIETTPDFRIQDLIVNLKNKGIDTCLFGLS